MKTHNGIGFEPINVKEMLKMKVHDDENMLMKQLITADAVNTFNGGMSMMSLETKKGKEKYILEVKAPGISCESLRVDIDKNILNISCLLHLKEREVNHEKIAVNYLIRTILIPYDVSISDIHARYEDSMLKIFLPFNEAGKGFKKNVPIINLN